MLLFANALQNPGEDCLKNVAVWIKGDLIKYAGTQQNLPPQAKSDPEQYELKNCLLLPGLVNAHAHLELTGLEDFAYPGCFVQWIKNLVEHKNQMDPDFQSRSIEKGIFRTILGGTTTIADHISFNSDLEMLLASPLRGKAFIEVLGVIPEVGQEIFQFAKDTTEKYHENNSLFEVLASPHSVHALNEDTLEKCFQLSQSQFSLHIAESQEEFDFFNEKKGRLFEFISHRGNPKTRNYRSAIRELKTKGWLNNQLLIIHGNYLDTEELNWISEEQISIVHCPYSHHFFSHQDFPLHSVKEKNINLALGTDSLASGTSLSMLDIMQQMTISFPKLSKKEIFHMATLGGAKALQMENKIGVISAERKADIIGIEIPSNFNAFESIFSTSQVSFSMINGMILIR